ncbi:hypothetical protein PMAYCL1PPCAC_01662 [Pristionchus mayeri]|uniref:Uncharacterized protein n=1 Tax=Pristionchus mayeri TaxID=1317129 RepID=A0AAN4Z517_9BILA|nr:hypothetical protein PMAYCL1PPCAC_01662 [Pristionchus mayeri]
MVSARFYSTVNEFMARPVNRPGLKKVILRSDVDALNVFIDLYPNNIPFYNREKWIRGRYKFFPAHSSLALALSGLNDPMIEQVADLLSTRIQRVLVRGFGYVDRSSNVMNLYERLLRAATIKQLNFTDTLLDDDTAPHVISIASRANRLNFRLYELLATGLSDTADFINKLCTTTISHAEIHDDMNESSSVFFGLPHSFWNKFLSEKLRNGSFARIEAGRIFDKKRWEKAPVTLPNSRIYWIHWER